MRPESNTTTSWTPLTTTIMFNFMTTKQPIQSAQMQPTGTSQMGPCCGAIILLHDTSRLKQSLRLSDPWPISLIEHDRDPVQATTATLAASWRR